MLTRERGFVVWLLACLGIWVFLVAAGDHWRALLSHWGIAVAMAVGSYFGASTPLGGGAVGFPVLVLLFGEPTAVGRDFSFAIQSAGMVSASIYLWVTRSPVAWRLLGWAVAAGALVVPLATVWLVPNLPALAVKLLFAVIWAGFGIAHAIHLQPIGDLDGLGSHTPRLDMSLGLAVGVVGGLVSAVTGVGINMLLYMALVMLFRTDAKIAIPTSVVAMAALSVVGVLTRAALGGFHPEVYLNWLTAAPIVVLAAPLGAYVVHLIPRAVTLWLVSVLCVGQFVWTCLSEQVTGLVLLSGLAGVGGCVLVFQGMYRRGLRLAEN